MLESETIKGNWYVHSENPKLVVDHEGYTVADVADKKTALRIVREHNQFAPMLDALKRMDALVEKLWKCVPWGKTWDLPVQELNEAPMQAKRAIQQATNRH